MSEKSNVKKTDPRAETRNLMSQLRVSAKQKITLHEGTRTEPKASSVSEPDCACLNVSA